MKTNRNLISTLLRVICGLTLLPLTVTAQNLVVNGSPVIDPGPADYAAKSGTAGLWVINSGSYRGANVSVSSTFATGNARFAVFANSGGAVALTGGTLSASGSNSMALRLDGAASAELEKVTVSHRAADGSHTLYAVNSSTLVMRGGTLSAAGGGAGFFVNVASFGYAENLYVETIGGNSRALRADNASTLTVRGAKIVTSGSFAQGVYINTFSTGDVADLTINTSGDDSSGLFVINSGTLTARNVDISTTGWHAMGLASANGATLTATNIKVLTTGPASYGLIMSSTLGSTATLNNIVIRTEGEGANGLQFRGDGPAADHAVFTLTMNGGAVQSAQAAALNVLGGDFEVTNPNADPNNTVHSSSDELADSGATYDITITGGAQLGGAAAIDIGSVRTGTDSLGNLVAVDTGVAVNLRVEDNSALTGDVKIKDSATLTLNLDDSTLTGDITGSGSAIVNVTVSGSASTLLGDIAQHDEAAVTVTIDNGAIGKGGYHGGNLITGGDSVWTFDKNSHGNYGENNGTWNIGDYEVIFDNMTHTGTINLSVNSDTGAGGSITVTGTADGEGKVHIDTTGNGQADPNKVLPGIVSGEGTEHWQWDPIDWGIDQLIKDGNHFIKNGTSPAGAVLNSSVAIQQAMWFAQQNSLLKRMGELRYGARASRPLADKDVRVPYNSLIDNIWLRSYGQQLNVGSQVSGKAYEQLIYGVDVGTDHKFTISADSDLYLGVYAGYGRSDIDYRTPGTDGEINSYYGGLYATWLHSSGFYIDATFKAASVDNNLKAPYGTTQLTASYSDVNIGGSIEIGHKFIFTDDWFIEPQLQVNYLHILAEDYTAGPMNITASDLDALQLRLGSIFGRTINLTNSGALQPYVKISGVETISSGGAIRNGYQHTRANTDGARAEVGGGIIWQLDANNQLHLDYEASFGDKYDKPWGLTAGYRHQF
ncbi:MAG: autotransporter outer membrane beta-barrel domain-containing protein [Verrucomicrobiales bacterium]|nr:autotransporter outer membrane beta-barrel domain-containing protein [Verrucomicrobiales bacterium]